MPGVHRLRLERKLVRYMLRKSASDLPTDTPVSFAGELGHGFGKLRLNPCADVD